MADIGRDLGVPYSTVAAWKQRGSIPVTYWRPLIDAGRRRGVQNLTSERLVALHDPDHSAGVSSPVHGMTEPSMPAAAAQTAGGNGQFSSWKALRRSHYATADEIVDHVRGLREEWERR